MSTTIMSEKMTIDQIFRLAQRLSPSEQVRLVARLASHVEGVLVKTETSELQANSSQLRGLLTDLGVAPSAADIDQIQQEMWGGFAEES